MRRPSRGLRRSAAPTRQNGTFLLPARVNLIVTAIDLGFLGNGFANLTGGTPSVKRTAAGGTGNCQPQRRIAIVLPMRPRILGLSVLAATAATIGLTRWIGSTTATGAAGERR